MLLPKLATHGTFQWECVSGKENVWSLRLIEIPKKDQTMRTRAANDNMVRTLVYFPCRMMIPGEKDYKSKMGKYIDQIEMWGPEMYGLPEGHPAFKAIARDIGRLRVMSA